MSKNVLVDSRRLMARFRKLEAGATINIRAAVRESTQEAHEASVRFVAVPVATGRRGQRIRSRPGQSPRSETGRLKRGLIWKLSPRGWVGYVTTNRTATDAKGRRYPWMLESGTRNAKKRPIFKKVQRKLARKFRQRVGRAMIDAIREADR